MMRLMQHQGDDGHMTHSLSDMLTHETVGTAHLSVSPVQEHVAPRRPLGTRNVPRAAAPLQTLNGRSASWNDIISIESPLRADYVPAPARRSRKAQDPVTVR